MRGLVDFLSKNVKSLSLTMYLFYVIPLQKRCLALYFFVAILLFGYFAATFLSENILLLKELPN